LREKEGRMLNQAQTTAASQTPVCSPRHSKKQLGKRKDDKHLNKSMKPTQKQEKEACFCCLTPANPSTPRSWIKGRYGSNSVEDQLMKKIRRLDRRRLCRINRVVCTSISLKSIHLHLVVPDVCHVHSLHVHRLSRVGWIRQRTGRPRWKLPRRWWRVHVRRMRI